MISKAFVKKHLTTIVLAVSALVTVVWAVIDAGSVTTGESERRKRNLFPAWRHDDVTRVAVQLPGERYELVRKGTKGEDRAWDLVQDGATQPADEQVVDRLLGTLEYATFSREIPAGSVDAAEFAADKSRARYQIQMGSLTFELVVGASNAGGDGVYVQVPGRGVYLVAASLVKALDVPARDLRGRNFLPYFATDVASITLEGEGGTRTFERAPWSGGRGSGFRFPANAGERAGKRVDATRLDQVLVAFGKMQAQGFLDMAQAEAALVPRVTITFVPQNGGPKGVIKLGGACPDKKGLLVAMRTEPTPLAVCLPEGLLTPLVRPIDAFDDNGLLGATADEIWDVHLERDGTILEVARVDAGFRMRTPETRDISVEAGNSFLEQIVDARGSFAAADAAFGEGKITKVRVVSVGGMAADGNPIQRVEELEIGPGPDGSFLAVRKEDGAKLVIGEVAAGAFRPNDLALRDNDLFTFGAEVVDGMTVEAAGRTQRFDREGGSWALTEPKGKGLRADPVFAQEAITAFADLRAARWAASKPEASFGLAEPRMRIVAHLAEGATSDPKGRDVAIRVGARTDDGAYAQIEGKDEVFVLPRRFEDAMSRLFVSRAEFSVPPEAIGSIVIERGEKKLTLERDGKQLRLKGGAGSSKEADLVDALAKLAPSVAVSVGAPTAAHGLDPAAITLRITFRSSPDDPPDAETGTVIRLGAQDVVDGVPVFFGRRDGVDAVYAIPERPVKELLAALGG